MRALVFAKAPIAGRAKTRLAARIGAERAAALAEAFVVDTLALVAAAGLRAELHCADSEGSSFFAALGVPLTAQVGQGLGERMHHALRAGSGPALIVGTDAPSLPAFLLEAAEAALLHAPLVFVPSADGGFVAVGARGEAAAVLCDPSIRYSSPHALADTLRVAASRGVASALTSPWFDVDVLDDLHVLLAHLALRPQAAPASSALLRSWDVRSF